MKNAKLDSILKIRERLTTREAELGAELADLKKQCAAILEEINGLQANYQQLMRNTIAIKARHDAAVELAKELEP